jgi:hypothetical protein
LKVDEYAQAMLAEYMRRHTWRERVERSGVKASKGDHWIERSKVSELVAKAADLDPKSQAFRRELRVFLKAEGWHERRVTGCWYWRARKG